MKILFKNARILKMDDSPIFEGNLLIEDNKIAKISKAINVSADQIIECNGKVIMPGFKNSHAHGGMMFLKSKSENLSLQDWLFNEVFPREEKLQPNDVYECCKAAFVEYVKSGITASFEQYFYPLETAKAAKEFGMRVTLLGTYNKITSYEDLIRLYHEFNDGPDSLVTYLIGIHAEYTCTDEEVEVISKACHATHSPFYAHISETKKEVQDCFEKRGMSPIEYFDSYGCFDYGGGGYHCIHLTEKDIDIFKRRKLSVVTNPGSNKKLSSGMCPVEKYLKEGINVAIGTDGPSSNDYLNIFKELKLMNEFNKALSNKDKTVSSYDSLKIATVNGAKAMGLNNSDIIEAGKFADLIMVDASNAKSNSLEDICDAIINNKNNDIVHLTMINGKILFNNGDFFIGQDINEIYKKVQDISLRIDKEANKCH